jgi:hypothetical protein
VEKEACEWQFIISKLWSIESLQRLFCRLILLVSVVAVVSESVVGVEGVGGMLKEPVDSR